MPSLIWRSLFRFAPSNFCFFSKKEDRVVFKNQEGLEEQGFRAKEDLVDAEGKPKHYSFLGKQSQ